MASNKNPFFDGISLDNNGFNLPKMQCEKTNKNGIPAALGMVFRTSCHSDGYSSSCGTCKSYGCSMNPNEGPNPIQHKRPKIENNATPHKLKVEQKGSPSKNTIILIPPTLLFSG